MKRFLIFLFLSVSNLNAQDIDKSAKDGLAIHVGLGAMYGGLGCMVEYQKRLNNNFKLTPFGALGAEFGAADISGVWSGYSVGMNLEYGRTHRFITGLSYGSHGVAYDNHFYNPIDSTPFEAINKHLLVGPSIIAGYKLTVSNGWIFQCSLGYSYMHNPIGENKKYYISSVTAIGIGYKF